MTLSVTTHSVIRNEERWAWFSLKSWEKYATKMLIVNDHSTDQTPAVLKSLKIPYTTNYDKAVVDLRNEMLKKTTTDWFILLDGDEIWNDLTIKKFLDHIKKVPEKVTGVFLRTQNCVGDVWHYLPDNAGKYELAGIKGHLNIRAYRRRPDFRWFGGYPIEYYGLKNQPINTDPSQLSFFGGFYWHMTNLARTKSKNIAGFRRQVIETGIQSKKENLPEVFFQTRPNFVLDPLTPRSSFFELAAKIITPAKKIKRFL